MHLSGVGQEIIQREVKYCIEFECSFKELLFGFDELVNGPGVAGAVLKTSLLLIS